MYIYTHIYTCEKLFAKTQSLKLALVLEAHFLEWRLTRFGKELLKFNFLFVIKKPPSFLFRKLMIDSTLKAKADCHQH